MLCFNQTDKILENLTSIYQTKVYDFSNKSFKKISDVSKQIYDKISAYKFCLCLKILMSYFEKFEFLRIKVFQSPVQVLFQ